MFCIAVLVAAAVAISAINEVEDHYNDHGSTAYEHADSYRRAAIWLLLVSSCHGNHLPLFDDIVAYIYIVYK